MLYDAENVGIDDFSTKKRVKYGTIIVDNDKHKKIDIINSREEDPVIKLLEKFVDIKTITRDFSQTYRNAIDKACPNAKQIVDRFHILKNFTDDIYEYLKRTVRDNIKIVKENSINEDVILNKRQKDKVLTAERKWETVLEAKKLFNDGKNYGEISIILNVCRWMASQYVRMDSPHIRSDKCILDNYITLIKKLIIEGKNIKEIYTTLKEKGYKGKQSLLYSRLKGLRQEVRTNTMYLKRSMLKKILYIDNINEIKDEMTREAIELYLNSNEELSNIIKALKEFKEILFSKKSERLDKWLLESKEIKVPELDRFIKLIKSDIDAVKNAIIYDYSNGLTEGFNNKTKVIKRQMYGRCSFDLLRLKILS